VPGAQAGGTSPELAAAGQWEWLLSWLGEAPAEGGLPKAEQWRLILPQLGFMAAQVKRSRQLPFRFLSAYLNALSLRWGHALETALDAAIGNIPELPGR
jgi:hypothetical protein